MKFFENGDKNDIECGYGRTGNSAEYRNVARTCALTGARLHLVGPMGFKIDDRKLKRAGLDYWHLLDITYYENLEEFFRKIRITETFIISRQKRLIVIPM